MTTSQVKSYPIPFTKEMVEAILAGTKSETRRPIQPQPTFDFPVRWDGQGFQIRGPNPRRHWWERIDWDDTGTGDYREFARSCPYGKEGDLLWVKETYALVPITAYGKSTRHRVNPQDPDECAIYVAGFERSFSGAKKSPRFMPRWASDIPLRNEGVEVQRLHDITEEQAKAEGVKALKFPIAYSDTVAFFMGKSGKDGELLGRNGVELAKTFTREEWKARPYRCSYALLWERFHGKDPAARWTNNPWVYRVQFSRMTEEVSHV